MLTRDQILNAPVETKEIDVPEFGGACCIRVVSGPERDAIVKLSNDVKGSDNPTSEFIAPVIVRFLCDEQGNRIFSDGDAPLIAAKSHKGLERIMEAGLALNRLTVCSIEEEEKNSEQTPNSDLGSESPAISE